MSIIVWIAVGIVIGIPAAIGIIALSIFILRATICLLLDTAFLLWLIGSIIGLIFITALMC